MQEINKYQKGQIYKIVDVGYNLCYYGSTINRLCQRMATHREHYKNGSYNCTVKQIFDTYGLENCKIELVENFPCDSRKELEAREGFYIKNNSCVNKNIAGRTLKESSKVYKETHKDQIKEYYKKYCEANKDKIKAYMKAYYEANKK
jgi:adenylate kinase family enzyme